MSKRGARGRPFLLAPSRPDRKPVQPAVCDGREGVCYNSSPLLKTTAMTVPRLTTALSGPLLDLERRILQAMPSIERWLRGQWQEHSAPFYASVDLRNSGFKLAPVDTNLFPAGFNNLNPDFHPLCVQAAMTAIEKICPDARGVLLIPENHTRNTFYLRNVAALQKILRHAGMSVRIGSLLPDVTAPVGIDIADNGKLTLEPITRNGNRL